MKTEIHLHKSVNFQNTFFKIMEINTYTLMNELGSKFTNLLPTILIDQQTPLSDNESNNYLFENIINKGWCAGQLNIKIEEYDYVDILIIAREWMENHSLLTINLYESNSKTWFHIQKNSFGYFIYSNILC